MRRRLFSYTDRFTVSRSAGTEPSRAAARDGDGGIPAAAPALDAARTGSRRRPRREERRLVIPKRPGLVAAKRAPDSRPRSGSFGKGHNGCAQRRTGHCRLLPHSTLRAPGRSRFREGAPAVAVGVEPGRLRLLPHSTLRAPGRSRRRATPECAKRASSLRVAAKKRVCVLFVSSMRLTPSGLARRFAPGETVLGSPICAPDAWPRSGSFGQGRSGCVRRRISGRWRLLPHSTLRAPGRSRISASPRVLHPPLFGQQRITWWVLR